MKKREVETVVMEEFMPLKGNSDREDERPKRKSADWTDKKTWMSSAQLWTTPIQYENGFDTVIIQDTLFLHQAVSFLSFFFPEHLGNFIDSSSLVLYLFC